MKLFVIEAPGKKKNVAKMLWKCSVRDVEIVATVGHIASNPDGFRPIGINSNYEESSYQLMASKVRIAIEIRRLSELASEIFLATDDDQEGDVIARDVARFCINAEDSAKVKRLRLKAISPTEFHKAYTEATAFDFMSAAKGDARRVIDRLIGSLSSDLGAVGRVQGSLLLTLQNQVPIIGIATYSIACEHGDTWIARQPIYAGDGIPKVFEFDGKLSPASSNTTVLTNKAWSFEDILLNVSLATGEEIGRISDGMQELYERGELTYPRSRDRAVSRDSLKRINMIAKTAGATFNEKIFKAVRDSNGEHTHESPNPAVINVPLNQPVEFLSLDQKILVLLTRNLIDGATPCQFQTPRLSDLAELPDAIGKLNWQRTTVLGDRSWESQTVPGFQKWTKEQSLLFHMTKNGLGRPSTIISHLNKFLDRNLVDQDFCFTKKGAEWSFNIGELFNNRNISRLVESYLEVNRKDSRLMVAEMLKLCGLEEKFSGHLTAGNTKYEEHEIYARHVS